MRLRKNRNPIDPSKIGEIDFILVNTDKDNKFLEVKKAVDILPQWFKDIPATKILRSNDKEEDLTIKRCTPVLDLLTTGYYLVTTEDYEFSKDEENSYFKGGKNIAQKSISMHPVSQIGDMPISPEFLPYAYKWSNQYLIKTPPGYSILFTHPMNYHYLPFYSLSGVVDTDTYTMPVLFPFMMKNNFEGVIPKGTPVIQILPFKRDDWESNIVDKVSPVFQAKQHEVSSEYERKRYPNGKAVGGVYKKEYRKKKRYL